MLERLKNKHNLIHSKKRIKFKKNYTLIISISFKRGSFYYYIIIVKIIILKRKKERKRLTITTKNYFKKYSH